jgi:osmoprotectant transport system ATP-binding protein
VLFDGEALSTGNLGPVRQRIGYVIQDGGLFPHLDAADNVTLMATYLGWDSSRRRERLSELAEMVKLDDGLLQRFPTQLSGGQRQRVALMRALMLDPELLLLDEPLGALDPIIRYDLQTDLRALFRELGKTVVIVSHDLAEAGWFGDTVILLDQGRIVQQGVMEELTGTPASPLVERFVQAQRGHGLEP